MIALTKSCLSLLNSEKHKILWLDSRFELVRVERYDISNQDNQLASKDNSADRSLGGILVLMATLNFHESHLHHYRWSGM